jgi:hypothetical protein
LRPSGTYGSHTRFLFSFLILLCSIEVKASFELGVGTSSSTSGRVIPALSATYDFGSWAVSGSSTGVRTSVYHLSGYTLGFVRRWNLGSFGWGDLHAGFGLGLAYSHYGYRESPDAVAVTKGDGTAGPLFQFRWMFLGPVYLGLDSLFGLRYPTGLLGLAAQDVILFSAGYRF